MLLNTFKFHIAHYSGCGTWTVGWDLWQFVCYDGTIWYLLGGLGMFDNVYDMNISKDAQSLDVSWLFVIVVTLLVSIVSPACCAVCPIDFCEQNNVNCGPWREDPLKKEPTCVGWANEPLFRPVGGDGNCGPPQVLLRNRKLGTD